MVTSKNRTLWAPLIAGVLAFALTPSAPALAQEASPETTAEHGTISSTPPNPRHMWDSAASEGAEVLSASQPSWGTRNSYKTFFDGYGNVYASPALKVMDVSEWQGHIDWQSVKNSDVDAVILRVGYGYDNEDDRFEEYLSEVKRLGIPYGIYLYSYAYDEEFARNEANYVADMISRYGLQDRRLPVFYDLEQWRWTGHTPPSTPEAYSRIVGAFMSTLESRGIRDGRVYSYTSYLQNELNAPSIWAKTSWVAQYGPVCEITGGIYGGQHGWQYTSSGSVPGVRTGADLSAFTNWEGYGYRSFSDVKRNDWYVQQGWLDYVVDNNLMAGIKNADGSQSGKFGPDLPITRGEVATILYRAAHPNSDATSNPDHYAPSSGFADSDATYPYARAAIKWAQDAGIITGYDTGADAGKFLPNNSVTRQELGTMAYRFAIHRGINVSNVDSSAFTSMSDHESAADYARAPLTWCADKGLITGNRHADGTLTLEPSAGATRSQATKILTVLVRDIR